MRRRLTLGALDGSSPLAFLAALGTFRLASLVWPQAMITLRWEKLGGWVPVIEGCPIPDESAFAQAILESPLAPIESLRPLGKNLTVAPSEFQGFAADAADNATLNDRRAADFSTSFGCEAAINDKGDRVQYSQFCFITGSGHQDFLGTLYSLREQVSAQHLHHALFEAIDDSDKSLSFRWNPTDAKEYAQLWENPSKTGVFTSWGANLLAFEALPFYPCMPTGHRLETTGFHRDPKVKFPEYSWPIWESPLNSDEVRSVVALQEIHANEVEGYVLRERGIAQVFRSLRVRIPPDGAQFKVSFRPARAV